ncbi:hypothetical protein Hanom_Chr03g00236221 [Helianthus anomalus]
MDMTGGNGCDGGEDSRWSIMTMNGGPEDDERRTRGPEVVENSKPALEIVEVVASQNSEKQWWLQLGIRLLFDGEGRWCNRLLNGDRQNSKLFYRNLKRHVTRDLVIDNLL